MKSIAHLIKKEDSLSSVSEMFSIDSFDILRGKLAGIVTGWTSSMLFSTMLTNGKVLMRECSCYQFGFWAVSSVGRAPHLQCGGQEFESPTVHGVKWLFSELFFCFFLQGCLETDKEIPLLGAILVRKSEMRYFEMIDFDIVR